MVLALQATTEVRAPWLAQQQEAGLGVDPQGLGFLWGGQESLGKNRQLPVEPG